ncbi:hypothetical protein [Photobacterium frigidiphilum]|nr:hypothetical protein [Photobacterium frigidiphilum]
MNKHDDTKNKQNLVDAFLSGILVALQSIALCDRAEVATEIVAGIGDDINRLVEIAKNEGGVDAETINWLVSNEIIDRRHLTKMTQQHSM